MSAYRDSRPARGIPAVHCGEDVKYLHGLPVQIVKVDRSLVVGGDSDRDLALYRSVVGLCDALGLVVIAEGSESAAQAETVHNAGCRLAQGHLFGSPVPISQLAAGVVAHGG